MGFTLVTGATSDIGWQICATLEAAGHSLLISDVDENVLCEKKVSLQYPERHMVLPLDLSDVEAAEARLTEYLVSTQIEVENAVFAAGVFSMSPVRIVKYSSVKKNFDIAVFSVFSIVRCLLSKKVNSGILRGIVLVSSVSAKVGTKGYTSYGAVKGAMLGLMKSLAVELAPRVRVNAVLPGGIRTRTTDFLFESQEAPNPRYLLGEGEKTDVSNMVEFLLSDKARWITGQEFVVDGGYTSN